MHIVSEMYPIHNRPAGTGTYVLVMFFSIVAGYGVFDRRATDAGHPWPTSGQGEDSGRASPHVPALHRQIRESPQQVHLSHGTTRKSLH